jgi:hypothetical protein
MTRWSQSSRTVCVVAAALLALAAIVRAQNGSLGAARDLYTAAAYDDALKALNGLRGSARREEVGLIERYRAFCFLALGRSSEADAAIEAAVAAAPFAQPSEADCSPRVRATFREVRRRVLPGIIEREYTDAKAAFDRKDSTAAARFTQVLALIADPDLKEIAGQTRLSQMRAMATDFLALSAPKAPAAPPVPLRAQPAPALPIVTPPARDAAHVYGPEDANVVPPSPVRQSFAPMADLFSLRPGAVEIVIDELGVVISAATKLSVNAVYDRLALSTAKTWRYRPALLDGVAVKYRMIVLLQPPQRH